MKIDTSDYYPWQHDRIRPAEAESMMDNVVKDAPENSDENVRAREEAEDKIESRTNLGFSDAEVPDEVPPQAPSGWITNVSHILSWVLSPVVIPTLGIISVFELSVYSIAPASTKWLIIGIVFALTCVIPSLAVYLLTRFGDVSDVALTRRSDRLIPYIITFASLLACGFYLTRTGLPNWVGFFYIGAAIATAVCFVINFKWKISAHGAGIGGLVALLMVLNRYGLPAYNLWVWVMASALAVGLLGAARVWLWRHTPMQTICGAVVGFLGVIMMESFFN